jgi:hypothetical protein
MGILLTISAFVVLGGGGLCFVAYGVNVLSTYLDMARSDPVDVRQLTADSGTVELAGTARKHDAADRAPFTDTETLLCEWRVSIGGTDPNTKGSGTYRTPFVLEDDTGEVLVDPDGATLQMEQTTEIGVDPDESPPTPIVEFLESTRWLSEDSPVRRWYRESRLDPGDHVHVYGPLRDVGHTADMPGGVTAVVGLENPQPDEVDVTQLTLLGIKERTRADFEQSFSITNGPEATATKQVRNGGLAITIIGGLLMMLPVAMVLFT